MCRCSPCSPVASALSPCRGVVDDWRACTEAAAALPSSLLYYPLFLVLLVAFCVLFQERGVVPVRKWLVRRLMPAPALAKVPRPA